MHYNSTIVLHPVEVAVWPSIGSAGQCNESLQTGMSHLTSHQDYLIKLIVETLFFGFAADF